MNNGKGDSPRNCFSQQYRENFDRIFRGKRIRNQKEKDPFECVMVLTVPRILKSTTWEYRGKKVHVLKQGKD